MKSKVVFCVEWGVSPTACAGKRLPRSMAFGGFHKAKGSFGGIDLRAIETDVAAKKFFYVGERDAAGHIAAVRFFDRGVYGYSDFAMGALEGSELRW